MDKIANKKFQIMPKQTGGHSLNAYTRDGDFIPTIYVTGQVKANGDLVGMKLVPIVWSELPKGVLGLKLVPDNYDPKGKVNIQIKSFEDPIPAGTKWKMVIIKSKQGNIVLNVERIPRTFSGGGEMPRLRPTGGGEAPR